MGNIKLVNKIIMVILSLILVSTVAACKAETIDLKETIDTIASIVENSKVETTTIVTTEDFSPVAEREKSLDKAGVNKEVVDISDVENGRVYQAIKYARLSADNGKIQKLLDVVNDGLEKGAESFKSDNKEYVRELTKESEISDYRYDYDSTDVVVTEMSDKYLSLRIFTYVNMMGAHPTYYIEGHIFDVNEGKELKVNDLVKDKETLRNFLYDWCTKNRESAGLFDEYKTAIDGYVDGEYDLQCYMEGSEPYIVFQTYDIAPYAAGAIHIKLPVEILK